MNMMGKSGAAKPSWRLIVKKFEKPSLPRSLGQIANTILPYFATLFVMYLMLDVSYWITLALAVPAAGFLIRIFIIFHDCGHGSFFPSKRANQIFRFLTGALTYTPSYNWTHKHAIHHATAGDLDHRGSGDVWTLTVQEYLALPRARRLWYRIYRNPIFMFGVGPLYLLLISYRFWQPQDGARERWSTIRMNLVMAGVVVVMSLTIGFKAFLMIQLPVVFIGYAAGVWLFYVQHQFEGTYWERHDKWSYLREALEGSSFYKLPTMLQWFTGSIGFHHIHHLSPRIPNYNLKRCHDSDPMFQDVKQITLWSSLKSLTYRLWDEDRKKLVGFSYVSIFLRKQAARS